MPLARRARPPLLSRAGTPQRVKFLRRAIVIVCTSAIGLIGFVITFDPLHRLKGGLSIGSVGISGTKVTMNDPKLSGIRRDGHAYEVKATTATQDTTAPTLLDLTGVDLRLGQADGSTTRITSQTGRYNTDAEQLDLGGRRAVPQRGPLRHALRERRDGPARRRYSHSDRPASRDDPERPDRGRRAAFLRREKRRRLHR